MNATIQTLHTESGRIGYVRARQQAKGIAPEYLILAILYAGYLSITTHTTRFEQSSDILIGKYARSISLILGLVVSAALIKRMSLIYLAKPSILLLSFFTLSCSISIINSPLPAISGSKVIELFLALALATFALSNNNSGRIDYFNINIRILLYLSIGLLLQGLIMPNRAWIPVDTNFPIFKFMLKGVYPFLNPNTIGLVGGIVAAAYFPKLVMSSHFSAKYTLPFLLSLLVVLFSWSRSSILSLIIVVLWALFILRRVRSLFLFLSIVTCVIWLHPAVLQQGRIYIMRGQRESTFEGAFQRTRGTAWSVIWDAKKNSIIGDGYGAGFLSIDRNVVPIGELGHAHNSFLQLLVDVGWAGVVFWVLLIASVSARVFRRCFARGMIRSVDLASVSCVLLYLLCKCISHSTLTFVSYDFHVLIGIIVYLEKGGRMLLRPHNAQIMYHCCKSTTTYGALTLTNRDHI